jgi:hypothetical protein
VKGGGGRAREERRMHEERGRRKRGRRERVVHVGKMGC